MGSANLLKLGKLHRCVGLCGTKEGLVCPERRTGRKNTEGLAGVASTRMPCMCAVPGSFEGENWTCVSSRGRNG